MTASVLVYSSPRVSWIPTGLFSLLIHNLLMFCCFPPHLFCCQLLSEWRCSSQAINVEMCLLQKLIPTSRFLDCCHDNSTWGVSADEFYSCFSSSWTRQPFKFRSMFLSSGDNVVHRLNLLGTGESRNSSGYMCELCTLHPIIHLKVKDWGPSHLCPGSAVIWGACWRNISQIFSSSGYWEGLMDVGSS